MASAADLTDREYQALARFRYALRVFVRFSEDAARAAGLTPAHHQLLLAIRGFAGDGPPSTSDLAELLQLRLHSVVELIGRAEAAGLVTRTADPLDARRQQFALSPAGAELLAELSAVHRDELRRFRAEMHDVLLELG
jgi:DNA-binding MarR family transcriptional regulator